MDIRANANQSTATDDKKSPPPKSKTPHNTKLTDTVIKTFTDVIILKMRVREILIKYNVIWSQQL